ncbi:MAG: choice-of-anchor D domain-containing protein, partial [Deltaproteobacteria bacterium]|nr:choice-of-anchor D domain-containing protein [Deltaproteobacteria bacterium]
MIHSNRAFVRGVLACTCAAAFALACGGSGATSGLLEDLDFLATPNSINFGTHSVGEDVVREVALRHTGTEGTVVIKGIRLAAGSSDEFSWDDPEALELKPGESVKLFVHYRPVSGDNASGTILIDHNVPPEKQSTIQLTALGQVGDLTTVPPVAFGEVPLADLPQDGAFQLKNLGSKAVKIDSMSLKNDDGRFTLHPEFVTPDNRPFPLDLEPGDAIGFVVTFNRTDVGEFDTERLWVYSGTERFEFPVTGTAVGPKIEVQPALVDFGFVKPGATASRDVLVINRGKYDLIVTDVLPFLGANSGIAVAGGPAAGTAWTLAPNQERTFSIAWTASVSDPPREGADLGQVHVISNDMAQSPTRVELKGELDIPCIAPDPEIIDFGYVAQGLATDRFLTIDNPCHGDLSVTSLEIDKAADTLGEFSIVADAEFPPTTGTG